MIKLLAKLRQYKDGDVAEYLRTEHRQNLIALEQAFGSNSASPAPSSIAAGTICFVGVDNVTPNAVFDGAPPYYHTGDVTFYERKTLIGSDVPNGWVCTEDGSYLIEVGHAFNSSTSGSTTKNMFIQINGSTVLTITDSVSSGYPKNLQLVVKHLATVQKGQLIAVHKPDSEKLSAVFMTKVSLKITKV